MLGGRAAIGSSQMAPDVRRQFCRRGIAPRLVLLERFADDGLDISAKLAVHRAQRRRFLFPNGAHRFVNLPPHLVRPLAGQQFVEDHNQRVDVAARVNLRRISQHLFGAHVSERADNLPDIRLPRRLRVTVGEPGDAEVQNLRLAVFADQNVRRFQITMDQPALVRMLHRIADSRHQLQPLLHVELMRVAIFQQGLPPHQLHRKKRLSPEGRLGRARVVNLRNPRMLQASQSLCLVLETPEHFTGREPARMTFSATVRCGISCSASYTAPIPPSPSRRRMR